jgi:hypothetical protein
MIHWLKRLFTDKDGDADEMALLTVCAVFVYLGLETYSVLYVKEFRFDPQSFGIGLAALIGAAAAGIGYKSSKEANP